MNKAYRLIWSKAKDAWVVAAEIIKGNGGPPPVTVTALMVATALALTVRTTLALPTAPQVVNGTAAISTSGSAMTITNSANAIINWQSFSIGNNETTRFIQPSDLSAVLNRVTGGDPSKILGVLQSNGKVLLINPNGILFGKNSRVDVGGLIASTLNITNQDFLAGKMKFSAGPITGKIENQGAITAPIVGELYLIATDVTNNGIITAPNGDILLAAGKEVLLVDKSNPEIAMVVSAPEHQSINLGTLVADAGRVGVYGGIVRQKGRISADSAVMQGGRIFLKATKSIELADTSVISADGAKGGQIVVKTEEEGKISGTLTGRGSISAQGDGTDGSGGFIETSAAKVDLNGINVRTNGGNWLIDPNDFTIAAAGGDIDGATLSSNLGAGDVSILSSSGATGVNGDIFVNDDITWNSTRSLTLSAIRDVNVNRAISNSGSGGVNLYANAADSGGSILLNQASAITTAYGGNITLAGGAGGAGYAVGTGSNLHGIKLDGATINAAGGNITLRGAGLAGTDSADGIYLANGSQIKTTGVGTITLAGRGGSGGYYNNGVHLGSNAAISSVNGAITITGEGGAVTGEENFGISIHDGAIVASSGTGAIVLNGTGGGEAGQYNAGIVLSGSGGPTRISSASGDISITGAGGYGGDGVQILNGAVLQSVGGNILIGGTGCVSGTSSDYCYGAWISDFGTRISTGGNISITGTSLGTVGDYNQGLTIDSYATVRTSGAGTISLAGTGGNGENYNYGVYLDNVFISTSGGALSINGHGNGSGSDNQGIYTYYTKLDSGGGPAILTGTGGNGLDRNVGVYLAEETHINTGGGTLDITGNGGANASGSFNYGINTLNAFIDTGSVDGSTAGGDVTLIGTGGAGTDYNHGVSLGDGGEGYSVITTGGGALNITGYGGGSGTDNRGIYSFSYSTTLDTSRLGRTAGGAITLIGTGGNGTDSNFGVYLSTNTNIITGGGNLLVTGNGAGTGANNHGIYIESATINTGKSDGTGGGDVTLTGIASEDAGGSSQGVNLNIADIITGGGKLTINGTGGAVGGEGIFAANNAFILNTGKGDGTGGGDVELIGDGGSGADGTGTGISLSDISIKTRGGALSITGNGVGTTGISNSNGIYTAHTILDTSRLDGSTGGDINLLGTAGNGINSNIGVFFDVGTSISSGGGALDVTGVGNGSGTGNNGIYTYYATLDSGAGAMTLRGTGADDTAKSEGLYFDSGTVIGGQRDVCNDGCWVPQPGSITLIAGGSGTGFGTSSISIVDIDDNGSFPIIRGAGALNLRPLEPASTITIGDGAEGGFSLSPNALSSFKLDTGNITAFNNDGFRNIVVGNAEGTGRILVWGSGWNVGGANLTLQNAGGGSDGIALSGTVATGSNLTVNTTGTVTQSSAITAAGLELLGAGGDYQLNNAGNSITTLAGNTGAVTFASSNSFDVGTVNRTIGLTASGNITLFGAGANSILTIAQSAPIVAAGLELLTDETINSATFELTDPGNRVSVLAGNVAGESGVSFANSGNFVIGNVNNTYGLAAMEITLNTDGAVTQTEPVDAWKLRLQGTGATYLLGHVSNNVTNLTGNTSSVYLKNNRSLNVDDGLTTDNDVTLDLGANTLMGTPVLNVGGLRTITASNSVDFPQTCPAGKVCWTGGGSDGNWSTAGNWLLGSVISQAGDTIDGSAQITNLSDTTGMAVGMAVSGTGITAGATILNIDSVSSITISANATGTAAAQQLKIETNAVPVPGAIVRIGTISNQTISLDAAATTADSLVTNENFIIATPGALTVSGGSAFNRTLTLSGTLNIGTSTTKVNTLTLGTGSFITGTGSFAVTRDFNFSGSGTLAALGSTFANLSLTTPASITLNSALAADNSISVTSTTGDIVFDASGEITTSLATLNAAGVIANGTAGVLRVDSDDLSIKAGNGVGTVANPLITTVGTLNAWNTTSGDIVITNSDKPLTITYINLASGHGVRNNAPGGKVKISNDNNIILNGIYAANPADYKAGIYTDGDISLTATGAGSDIITGGGQTAIASAFGNIELQAGRDVVLGSSAYSSVVDAETFYYGDVYAHGKGNISIIAGRDIVIDNSTYVDSDSGNIMIDAVRDVSLLSGLKPDSRILAGADPSQVSGAIDITARGGQVTVASGTSGILTNGAAITLTANNMDLQGAVNSGFVDSGSYNPNDPATVILQTYAAATQIAVGAGASDDPGGTPKTLGLNDTELGNVTAGRLIIGSAGGTGKITVTADGLTISGNLALRNSGAGSQGIAFDGPLSAPGYDLTLNTTGLVTQDSSHYITADRLELLGSGAIYTLDTPGGNIVGILAGNTGSVNFINSGELTIGTVNSTVGLTVTGDTTLYNRGVNNLTIANDIRKAGSGDATLSVKSDYNSLTVNPNTVIGLGSGAGGALNVILDTNGSNEGGNILFNAGTRIRTNGGNLVMGSDCGTSGCVSAAMGYSDVTGYREGIYLGDPNSGSKSLVRLDTSKAGGTGGNIWMNGQGMDGSSNAHGVYSQYAGMHTGGGNVNLIGAGGFGYDSDDRYGVFLENTGISTGGGALNISGTGGGGGGYGYGIYTTYVNLATGRGDGTSGGTATLSGTGGSDGYDYNHGVYLDEFSRIATGGGTIIITGNGGVLTDNFNYGIYTYKALLDSSKGSGATGGTVQINGTGGGDYDYNYGVYLDQYTRVTTGGGAIEITGTGYGTGIRNYGIRLYSTILDTRSLNGTNGGEVTLTGEGGAGSNYNYAVYLDEDTRIATGGGAINITGTGYGTGYENYGIYGYYADLDSAGGEITLSGTGGNGTDGNEGVYLQNTQVTTGGGALDITGIAGGSGNDNYGIYTNYSSLDSGNGELKLDGRGAGAAEGLYFYRGTIIGGRSDGDGGATAPQAGNITLIAGGGGASSFAITNCYGGICADFPIIQGTGTLNLRPFSDASSVGLADGAGDFNLGSTALGAIKPGFKNIIIGNAAGTGLITMGYDGSGWTVPGSANLTLQNPGVDSAGIIIGGPFASTGNITLNSKGTVTQSASITAASLGVIAGGAVNLTSANSVGNLAIETSSGSIGFTNGTSLNIASLTGGGL
ncbi:MAG: filamentous hemagglutinin N-terminal domain-containing protein, partial [Methylococcales bacterium]|nr:filamentous hemagglutinin N-terminal domain-containing protein [Methylococcales bacterium]